MFWDRVAGVYDIFVNVINRKTHRSLKRIVAAQIEPGDIVLECACGTGLLSAVIAPGCRHLTATDFSAKMVQKAKKNCAAFSNISFAQADITALPYADGCFDKVVAGNVIHLLDEPLKALRELNRVCKDGGLLIIPTYMNQAENGDPGKLSSTLDKAGADFKREFTVDSYKQFFSEVGYADVRVTLAEEGSPAELFAKENSLFRRMAQLQNASAGWSI